MTSNACSRLALPALLYAFFLTHSAAAQAPTTAQRSVVVDLSRCDSALATPMLQLLRIELGERVNSAADAQSLRAVIACEPQQAALQVGSPTGLARSEQLSLSETPVDLRPRVLALQLAELVRSLDQALQREPKTQAAPHAPMARMATPSPASPQQPARLQLGVFGQLTSFSADGRWLAGAGVRLRYEYKALALGLDGAFALRTFEPRLGEVRVIWGYAAPHLAWVLRLADARVKLGAGYALGAASVRGANPSPSAAAATQRGFWAAPYALLELGYAVTPRALLWLQASAGWVHARVIGEVARGTDVALSGVWTQLQVGAAWGWR